jgi:cobalt-precorrin-5B (C1)-methyltransferase
MTKQELRHGYTTGACATAAAKGAALILREQRLAQEVEITLPMGETAVFRLHGQEFTKTFAACYVVKDAGDDPDVTGGAEIHAEVSLAPSRPRGDKTKEIVIEGGIGIGRITKPGLAVPVGEWAINPVPRRMINEAVLEVFTAHPSPLAIQCRISIPNGAELAKKTLNARLGIVGGLSILGTTGIVKPVSAKAWTDTIDAAIDVSLACGCGMVVLSTGRTSELVAQKHLGTGDRKAGNGDRGPGTGKTLPEEAFVMMGDHVGYALRACAGKGVRKVVIAGQFAKLLKIACGHEQTHVSSSELDLRELERWLVQADLRSPVPGPWSRLNSARQVLEASDHDPSMIELVCHRAREFAKKLAPGLEINVLLAGYHGEVLYCA